MVPNKKKKGSRIYLHNSHYQKYFLMQDKQIVPLTITMSEEPLNREDDLQEDVRDTAEDTESGLDEAGDKIKSGAKAMGNKIKDPDKDMGTEYSQEKFKEEVKDY